MFTKAKGGKGIIHTKKRQEIRDLRREITQQGEGRKTKDGMQKEIRTWVNKKARRGENSHLNMASDHCICSLLYPADFAISEAHFGPFAYVVEYAELDALVDHKEICG